MGTMKIRVDAPPVNFAFQWDGNRSDIDNIMSCIEDEAAKAGYTPEQFAQSTLFHLPTMGFMTEPGPQQLQMMAIMYTILNHPTMAPGWPGSIYRYAADEDIVVRLRVSGRKVKVQLAGRDQDEDEV
jgi:hypothetical protein